MLPTWLGGFLTIFDELELESVGAWGADFGEIGLVGFKTTFLP